MLGHSYTCFTCIAAGFGGLESEDEAVGGGGGGGDVLGGGGG
jgi:hypothetical protein